MYNEEAGAERCVRAVCGIVEGLPVRACLIAVNDGSRDGTRMVLDRLALTQAQLEVVHHEMNRGYGVALRSGVEQAARAGFDFVLFMDSDLTNSPADIPKFVEAIAGGAEVVKATRYRDGGAMRGVPLRRQLISRTGALVARVLFHAGLSDCTNGFRAVRTSLLMRLRLRETRFPVIVEELYCCIFIARRFAEVPVRLTNREASLRPTSFGYQPDVFWRYLKYALLACFRIPPTGRVATD